MSIWQAIKVATKESYKRYKDKHKKYNMYCMNCDKRLTPDDVYTEDVGIGPYDYWGSKGVDVQIVVTSNCCNDAVADVNTVQFIKPEDVR